jgi:hypothetical protein
MIFIIASIIFDIVGANYPVIKQGHYFESILIIVVALATKEVSHVHLEIQLEILRIGGELC